MIAFERVVFIVVLVSVVVLTAVKVAGILNSPWWLIALLAIAYVILPVAAGYTEDVSHRKQKRQEEGIS